MTANFPCNPFLSRGIYYRQRAFVMEVSNPDSNYRLATTTAQRTAAVLCLVLAVFASSAAVLHVHPNTGDAGPNATHCLICVAAHSPTLLVSVIAFGPLMVGAPSVVSPAETDPHSRYLSHDLFIRPPPAAA